MNRIFVMGRLTRDPEVRYTPAQKVVCSFTLAVDRPFLNQQGQREADFIPVVVWGKAAANPYSTTITCISWGLLVIAMISLVLALVSFLCRDAQAYAWLVKEISNLAKWFKNPVGDFIPTSGETAVFLPTKSAITGFVSFMLGFLNFALVLLGKFICVCPLALVLANVLVGILIYVCLKPFLQIMNSRID